MLPTSFSKKIIASFIAGLTTIALLLMLGNSGTLKWFPPVLVFSMAGIVFLSSLIFPFSWQSREKKQQIDSAGIYAVLYGIIRYTLAFNIASFGWKKLFGLQFIVPAEIASQPMNQQSGEWLTWFYFGHSFTFGVILSIIQIGGACLLLFRRTLLPGGMILFAFMLNLTLINIFYQMNTGALLQSVIITMGIIFLILLDYDRLVLFFVKAKSHLPSLTLSRVTKNSIKFSAILLSLLFTLYLKSLLK